MHVLFVCLFVFAVFCFAGLLFKGGWFEFLCMLCVCVHVCVCVCVQECMFAMYACVVYNCMCLCVCVCVCKNSGMYQSIYLLQMLTKSPQRRLCDLYTLQDLPFFRDFVFSDLIERKVRYLTGLHVFSQCSLWSREPSTRRTGKSLQVNVHVNTNTFHALVGLPPLWPCG